MIKPEIKSLKLRWLIPTILIYLMAFPILFFLLYFFVKQKSDFPWTAIALIGLVVIFSLTLTYFIIQGYIKILQLENEQAEIISRKEVDVNRLENDQKYRLQYLEVDKTLEIVKEMTKKQDNPDNAKNNETLTKQLMDTLKSAKELFHNMDSELKK